MGGFPQTGPKKFKLFNHPCQTHEIFRVDKYYKKIIFGYIKMWDTPQTGMSKFQIFNHSC